MEINVSYTSKASFMDLDVVPTYKKDNNVKHVFSGIAVSRGLYRTKNNIVINADVNGSYNILRKELFEMGKDFTHEDIAVLAVIPVRVKSANEFHKFL
jgi:transposase